MRYLRSDTESFAQCIENMRIVQKIREKYKEVNNDEIEALKIQMQLRDKLKLRTGD
jgi:hypothetical protein